MEKVWLSSTYYLDPKVIGLSADAERIFTRGLAYSGNAETRGFIPDSALTQLGNKRGSRPVRELTDAELWTKVDGGYQIRSWSHWQKNSDDLLERRKKDRARQARHRESVREQSRDMSRDVTGGEENREEKKRTTHVENASHVSNASVPQAAEQTGPRVPVDGWRLVRDTHGIGSMPQATKTALALKAAELLHAGTDERHIRDALDLWMAKPDAGPGLLPHLVAEAIKTETAPVRTAPAAGNSHDAKVVGYLDIGRSLTNRPTETRRELA